MPQTRVKIVQKDFWGWIRDFEVTPELSKMIQMQESLTESECQ